MDGAHMTGIMHTADAGDRVDVENTKNAEKGITDAIATAMAPV